MLVKARLDNYYVKNPDEAFREGFHKRIKIKRSGKECKYDQYHYYVPSNLCQIIKFLRNWFEAIDSYQHADSSNQHKFRNTKEEFPDLAIANLRMIYKRICINDPIIAGHQELCPVPWAVFGNNRYLKRLCKVEFPTIESIFEYYDNSIWDSGFTPVNILRPLDTTPQIDKLKSLADMLDLSVNYVLSVGILLLFDLIRNAGPCKSESVFWPIFSNEPRGYFFSENAWIYALTKVKIPEIKDLGSVSSVRRREIVPYYTKSYIQRAYGPYTQSEPIAYSEVQFEDEEIIFHEDKLFSTEKVELFGTVYKKQTPLNRHDGDGRPLSDYEEELLKDNPYYAFNKKLTNRAYHMFPDDFMRDDECYEVPHDYKIPSQLSADEILDVVKDYKITR